MTVLQACQDAAKQLKPAATVPQSVFGSSETFAVELAALCNEAATAIAKVYDWRKLTTLATQVGDGAATAFDLPSDYDRMPVKAKIFSGATSFAMTPIQDLDIWMDHRLRAPGALKNEWIILGGQLHIEPFMSASESAKFYYISNAIVTPQAGANKARFDADTDEFRLSERLLTLDLIWRWRQRKGLDYAEDMRNSEIALSQEIVRDKGSNLITVGRVRWPAGAELAFPGVINDA